MQSDFFYFIILFGRWVILSETLSLVYQSGAVCSHKRRSKIYPGVTLSGHAVICWSLWPVPAKPNSSVTSSSGIFKLKKGLEYASNSSDKLQTLSSS